MKQETTVKKQDSNSLNKESNEEVNPLVRAILNFASCLVKEESAVVRSCFAVAVADGGMMAVG